ncbi:MAG: tyrosine-type recombinase/integrase [candidate division Zixibacteria bacterium]|nr:tyrosine-type recombinase/integrase [candidate division Zixibacteria bacterium]
MKREPNSKKALKKKYYWIIDESKCLSIREVAKLQQYSNQIRIKGLDSKRFSLIRRWFMIELGIRTGLRVKEMASLKHKNMLIDDSRSSFTFIGKGNKPRLVWINSEFRQLCHQYISYKKMFGYDISGDTPLLNNLKGKRISRRALQKDFKTMTKGTGLPSRYHIHNLRHTYATYLLKASNHNYRFVQRQLGHSSIRTTQVYASVLESEGRKALENIYR